MSFDSSKPIEGPTTATVVGGTSTEGGWFWVEADNENRKLILRGPFGDDAFIEEINRLRREGHYSDIKPLATGELLVYIVTPNNRYEYLDLNKLSLAELRRMAAPSFLGRWV